MGNEGLLLSQNLWLAVDAIKKFRPLPKPRRCVTGWRLPPIGELKWNVDGSSIGKPGLGSAGGVLRDHTELVRCIFSIPYGIVDSNLAELIAIRKALQLMTLNSDFCNVKFIVESDSLNAINWINNASAAWPWVLHNELCGIINLKASFSLASFVHTLWENNYLADAFAKQGVRRTCDFFAWL